jgi:hypothetical protein
VFSRDLNRIQVKVCPAGVIFLGGTETTLEVARYVKKHDVSPHNVRELSVFQSKADGEFLHSQGCWCKAKPALPFSWRVPASTHDPAGGHPDMFPNFPQFLEAYY